MGNLNDFFNNLDIHKHFSFCVAITIELADTSDFDKDEIRSLINSEYSKLKDSDKWDRKIIKSKPIEFNIGINKNKDSFYYTGGKWIAQEN